MTSREIVRKTILFEGPERLAYALDEAHGTDFAGTAMDPSPDARPKRGVDEWGCVWENIGISNLGEVAKFPLKEWELFDRIAVPDVRDPRRWEAAARAREAAGDKFLIAGGISLYERAHFLRGLENLWVDIHNEPARLAELVDLLAGMNIYAIERFAQAGADGYMWCDDWGLQKGLMISPGSWREIWKPRYEKVYTAAHEAGLFTFLHSCGDISSILDDFIEIGLDVIQMDQQENMGLESLGERFGGRVTFWCPVDIQSVMARGSILEIKEYCRRLKDTLGRPEGGFIAKYYADPKGAGHTPEAVSAMCDEFLKL